MKNLHKNLLSALVVAAGVIGSFNAMAQYPAASVLLVNHDLTKYSINSTEEYIRIEDQIAALGENIGAAYKKHPNLSYLPVYNDDQIVAFMINGVNDSEAANQISNNLMQLEILSHAVHSMDESFLPTVMDSKLSRVSKKAASK
ncbi:MAG TPA: hypothetical protein VK589_01505 [Chryseolinea sp.]|nr:hypothetical protein [Chryseolinea sp.]